MHADEVVSVHDGVNESVQHNGKVYITIIENVGVQPVEKEDGDVVVDVQKRQLPPFLAEDNENGIPEVPHLGNVEEPQQIRQRRIITAVTDTRDESVATAVCQKTSFNGHVGTEHNLRNIVDEFDGVGVNGRAVGHNLGADNNKQEVRERNVESTGKVGQRPTLFVTRVKGNI